MVIISCLYTTEGGREREREKERGAEGGMEGETKGGNGEGITKIGRVW